MSTLIIDNVDLEMLEQQRLTLIEYTFKHGDVPVLLEGLQAMLDAWSDQRYYDRYDVKKIQLGLNF